MSIQKKALTRGGTAVKKPSERVEANEPLKASAFAAHSMKKKAVAFTAKTLAKR